MKKLIQPTLMVCAILVLAGCSATNQLTMGAVEPARVHIPTDVSKIGIVNRSVPSEGNKTVDKIDKILSLEGLNLDKEGAEAAVLGLSDELERSERFEAIKIIESSELERKGLGVFPAALSWKAVESICEANDVEVLFSLELYDTDTKVDYQTAMVKIPNNLGIKAEVPGHKVTINTAIKSGWRVYDPHTKTIIDAITANDYITSRGEGINPMKAVEAVIGRKEAVLQQSTFSGNAYAKETRPRRKRISRDYFVKGTNNFEIAQRRAQTGDWKGAADLWEKEVTNSDPKIAGRACYNMAISNEINGDLNKAVEWASKSYSDYEINEALRYLNLLRRRVAEKEQLRQQEAR